MTGAEKLHAFCCRVLHGDTPHTCPRYFNSFAHGTPHRPFSAAYVKQALGDATDWRQKGAVTPAKDQGSHGYCGTFGRTAAAEGQYALQSPKHTLRNLSEQMLVECIGWDMDQMSYFGPHGFMSRCVVWWAGVD